LSSKNATDAEKLEAIATIKARGDQEALALLTGLSGDQPPAIARAASNATAAIQNNLAIWPWYRMPGTALARLGVAARAIGLAITFGVMA